MTNGNSVYFALSLLAFAWITQTQHCQARESEAYYRAPTTQSADCATSSAVAQVPQRALKSIPTTVEVYQYDNSPLEHRKPLLMIHGLLGEFHPQFRWNELAHYLSQDQAFQQRYKIYLARYDSHLPLKELTWGFNVALRKLAPTGGLTIVTISMASTIVRNAMSDPAVDQSVSRVLTLGAFFRGSPLFCSDWMRKTIRQRHLSPLCRIDRYLAYKLYFARHKNLLLDYSWDNVDGQMPAAGLPQLQAECQSESNLSAPSHVVPAAHLRGDHKFIVYAGYIHNRYVPQYHGAVYAFIFSPFTFFRTTLQAHFGREHPALRFLNELVADAVPASTDKSYIAYPLNDGISPISSSLLLSDDFVSRHLDFSDKTELDDIEACTYAKKARLFDNVDHLTFIEGHRPIGSSLDVSDVLSPTEKPRPMFAWILKDLLE